MTPAPTADRRSRPLAPYDALVLAGGQARRLGGVDKMAIPLGGRDLLDRVLDAVPDVDRVVVVGPPRPLPRPVAWRREDPPGGGPVAAIAAGLPATSAPLVAVLAGDLPFLTASAVGALRFAVGPDDDGVLLVDADGRAQLLAGVWRSAALRPALARFPETAGVSVRRLLEPLRARHLATGPAALAAPPWWDCDTAGSDEPQGADVLDRDLVLDLARDVAHGVARPAAPLTTYLVGLAAGLAAARAGSSTADWDRATRAAASRISALAAAWGPAPED